MYSDCIFLNIMVRLKKAVWEGARRFYGCCQRLFGSCQWRNQAGRPGVLQGLQAGLRGGLLRWELLPSEDRFFWTPLIKNSWMRALKRKVPIYITRFWIFRKLQGLEIYWVTSK